MLRWAKPHTRCSPAGGCGAAAASSLAGLRVGKADGSGGNRKVVARLGRSMDDGWMRSRVGAVEDREDVDRRRRGDRVVSRGRAKLTTHLLCFYNYNWLEHKTKSAAVIRQGRPA